MYKRLNRGNILDEGPAVEVVKLGEEDKVGDFYPVLLFADDNFMLFFFATQRVVPGPSNISITLELLAIQNLRPHTCS